MLRCRVWLGGNVEMLVRYYVAEAAVILRESSFAERETRCRRIETISTFSGGLILLAMLATLLIVQG